MPGEQYAMHARRRFRLVPAPGHPNPPQVDISLFIVHWGPADPNDRMPVKIDPKEHCEYAWITEEEAFCGSFAASPSGEQTRSLQFVSDQMRKTILEGFRIAAR